MKRLLCSAIFLIIALPVFAQGPEGFVGDWKSDPGTPTMTRKLALDGKVIVMTELQPGRNGGPELTIIRKYPTDGSTVTDPASGSPIPAVLLRMSRTRAHTLAHLLDDWCRVARVYATLRSSEVTERALVWALEASAAATGDPEATRCALSGPQAPSVAQRLAAAAVLSEREHRINPVQRIAIVDAAARWLAEDAGKTSPRPCCRQCVPTP